MIEVECLRSQISDCTPSRSRRTIFGCATFRSPPLRRLRSGSMISRAGVVGPRSDCAIPICRRIQGSPSRLNWQHGLGRRSPRQCRLERFARCQHRAQCSGQVVRPAHALVRHGPCLRARRGHGRRSYQRPASAPSEPSPLQHRGYAPQERQRSQRARSFIHRHRACCGLQDLHRSISATRS